MSALTNYIPGKKNFASLFQIIRLTFINLGGNKCISIV